MTGDGAADPAGPGPGQRPVSRRALLTAGAAGAGAIVGAGATLGVEALTATPARAPVVPPSEDLMVDHGVLKRILLAYREISRQVTAGRPVPLRPTADAAALIQTYIESYHEGLEEAYVFPRLQQAARLTDLVRVLLVQHDRGRHLTAAIAEISAGAVAQAAARAALVAQLDAFVRMYEPHEAWEDTVVFPAFREITPDRVFTALGERFADEERAQFGAGATAQMVERVAAIESALGVGDLDTFTPPPTT